MTENSFRPMLLPNNKVEEGQEELFLTGGLDIKSLRNNVYYVSIKRNGIRAEIGNGKILTRSMKEFTNKYLEEYFEEIVDLTQANNIILEGEIYSPTTSFDDLSGILRSKDGVIPEDTKFFCFDYLSNTGKAGLEVPFWKRYNRYKDIEAARFEPVFQHPLYIGGLYNYFEGAIENGFEGIVLKNPDKPYKLGRLTKNDDIGFKMKEINTYEATVIGVEPEYQNSSESYVNELGYKTKHKYKESKVPLEKIGVIIATHGDQTIRVPPAMTDQEKEYLWTIKDSLNGSIIEVKGTESSKGKIRHPVLVRFRQDKEEE